MTPQSLLKVLKATAEQKGYFLHADEEHCLATAESLLENKQRYGYLCCPMPPRNVSGKGQGYCLPLRVSG